MNRVNKVLLSLSAVLVLLTITGIVTNLNGEAPLKVEAIEAARVSSISISSPQASIQLRRTAKEWVVLTPAKVRANQQRVQALLSDWSGGMVADSNANRSGDEHNEAHFGLNPTHRRALQIRSGCPPGTGSTPICRCGYSHKSDPKSRISLALSEKRSHRSGSPRSAPEPPR